VVHRAEVVPQIQRHFAGIFERELQAVSLDVLEQLLNEHESPVHAAI
jgi:hypothetical protein